MFGKQQRNTMGFASGSSPGPSQTPARSVAPRNRGGRDSLAAARCCSASPSSALVCIARCMTAACACSLLTSAELLRPKLSQGTVEESHHSASRGAEDERARSPAPSRFLGGRQWQP